MRVCVLNLDALNVYLNCP